MAGYLFSNSMLMLERAMDFQWTKFNAISDNIVNAETPGYKAKYVTFEEALDSSIRRSIRAGDGRSSAMRSVLSSARPIVHVAENESMRMDDNGVNVAEQETELIRNTYQMQYTMDAINGKITLLRTLIRGQ